LQKGVVEVIEEKLPDNSGGKVAVRLLYQQRVTVLHGAAQVGQVVFGAALALQLGGVLVETAGFAQQVEPDVGHSQILLQNGAVPAPFREAMAQNQACIGQLEHVAK
jgi:hypothetical protein